MSATRPPPIRVPKSLAANPEVFGYFNDLHTFLRLLWERTGGGEDAIETAVDASALLLSALPDNARIGALNVRVDDLADEVDSLSGAGDPILAYASLPDNARIAVVNENIQALSTTVASLQSLHGKMGASNIRLDTHDEYFAYFETLLITLAGLIDDASISAATGPDAARYAHIETRINDLEILSWL